MAVEFEPHPDLPFWGMQPTEPSDCFATFVAYRDMKPRGLKKLAEAMLSEEMSEWGLLAEEDQTRHINTRKTLLGRWSDTYMWVRRAKAYDCMMDAERIGARVAATHSAETAMIEAAAVKHGQIASMITSIAHARLARISKLTVEKKGENLDDMKYDTVLGWSERGVNFEKNILGMQTADESAAAEASINGLQKPVLSIAEAKRIARQAMVDMNAEEDMEIVIEPPPKPPEEGIPDASTTNPHEAGQ